MRAEAPRKATTSSQTSPRSHEEHSHASPPFKPQIQKFISFRTLWVSENPEKTLSHLKEILIFAPFQPISAPLRPVRSATIVQPPRCFQVLPGAAILSEERKPTRQATRNEKKGSEAERKKGSDKPTSPQKRGTPLLLAEYRRLSPHHKFAPKNQQKVAWGGFEKIFGKIFRWNVSGVRKTPCVSQRKGACLTNENREISNLAMQITKNAQKHCLITECKGMEKESHLQG